jgi:hypothetical protein
MNTCSGLTDVYPPTVLRVIGGLPPPRTPELAITGAGTGVGDHLHHAVQRPRAEVLGRRRHRAVHTQGGFSQSGAFSS